MTGIAIGLLFGAAFGAALWSLVTSILAQYQRFIALFFGTPRAAPPAPRLSPVRVHAMPARMLVRRVQPQHAAA